MCFQFGSESDLLLTPQSGCLAVSVAFTVSACVAVGVDVDSVVFVLIFEIFSNVSVDCVGCASVFNG